MLSVRLGVTAGGSVSRAELLCDTTRVPSAQERERRRLVSTVVRTVRAMRFPRHRAASRVTLPLVFER
jgi:hypothetical protein